MKANNRGSVFLVIVVAVVFVTVLAVVVTKLIKLIRRVDGMQDRRFSETNDMTFTGYPGVANVQVQNQSMSFEWWDLDYWPPAADANPASSAPPPVILELLLQTDGLVRLSMANVSTLTNRTWGDLGVELDAYGFPVERYWIANPPYSQNSVPWTLQRSTDLVQWTNMLAINLQTNVPQRHQDDWRGKAFYRMMR